MSSRGKWFRPCVMALVAALLMGLAPAPGRAEAPAAAFDLWLPSQPVRAPARLMSGVGKAHLDLTTRSGEAMKFFDQGLALLLEGWPGEADRSFARVAQLDPRCAMAQWGIAMVALNPARRDSAFARAQELGAGASPHERLYLDALAALNAGAPGVTPGGPAGTSEDYRRALRKIVGSFPNDLTARVLLAQSLVAGYDADGTPRSGTLEAIALCERVVHKDPSNAPAHHTLVHAYESGPSPEKGARSAELFAKAAPSVAHALHLAGRLAIRLNHGDDAVRSFEAAAALDEAYMRTENESSAHSSGPYSHTLFLLATTYGDQGRYGEAIRSAARLLDRARLPGEAGSAVAFEGRLAALRLPVRFGRWNENLDGQTLPDDGGFDVLRTWRHYALGRAWLGRGDVDHAWAELVALDRDVTRLKRDASKSAPLRPLQDRQMPALIVASLELKGRILAREGMGDEALAVLLRGLELEQASDTAEPGFHPQPMEEARGDVTLDLRRWSDAAAAYRAALERAPGDGRALLGLARALEGAGKKQEASQARAQLAKLWIHADPAVLKALGVTAPGAPSDQPKGAPGPTSNRGAKQAGGSEPQAAAPAPEPVATAPQPSPPAAQAPVAVAARPPAPDPYAGKLRKLKVGGVQLAYVDIGKGQPIVLVHGALSDYRQWAPQIEALSKRYRVIAYSRRYHYPNPPADDHADYSYALNEEDLVALLRSLRLGQVHLLVHGYGGFVATLVARDHPELVRTLLLAEPGVYSMIPWKKDRRAAVEGLKAAAAASGDAVRAGDFERAVKQFYAVVQGNAGAFDSLPEPQRRIMRDNASTLLLGIESPPAFPCEQVHGIGARTLLIQGDASTRNERAAVEGLDRCLPNRDRATIKGASRVVNRGNPDAFNDAIIRFLEAPEAPVHLRGDEE